MVAPNSGCFTPSLEPSHFQGFPTTGPLDVCAHFKYLLKQLCPPRVPPASCLSVRLSLRTERLQEASFLPPPLLASTHAHPAAGCPPAPAAATSRGRCILPVPEEEAGAALTSLLGAKALGMGKG